jgi:hypothetical protein
MDASKITDAHDNSIRQLIGEFGQKNETIVRATYDEQRKRLEKEAIVNIFVPILACRATLEVLQQVKPPITKS